MDLFFWVLVLVIVVVAFFIGKKIGSLIASSKFNEELKLARLDAVKRSRSIIGGQVSEQLAPYLPGFNHKPSESRFIGKPIDFIVFKGMDDKKIEEIVFVEVKSGNSQLNAQEKMLKQAVLDKRVSWEELRLNV